MGTEVTELLRQARDGEPGRLSLVFEALYPELRRLAAARLHGAERTVGATGLVHELYLRLATGESLALTDRRHFFAAAARAMRWILADDARRRCADKRGAGAAPATLTGSVADHGLPADVLALQDALDALDQVNPLQREIVDLHVFAGLEFAEIAQLVGCSERSVYRHWQRARAFLHAQLAA